MEDVLFDSNYKREARRAKGHQSYNSQYLKIMSFQHDFREKAPQLVAMIEALQTDTEIEAIVKIPTATPDSFSAQAARASAMALLEAAKWTPIFKLKCPRDKTECPLTEMGMTLLPLLPSTLD